MSDIRPPTIIIKRIKKNKPEHHGGAWKIAYADFVTAMMAFFMLLWLLSLLNKYQLQGISAYFQKPLKDVFVGSKNADDHKKTVQETREINKNKGNSTPVLKEKHAGVLVPVLPVVKPKQQRPAFEKDKDSNHIKGDIDKEMHDIKKQLDVSLKNNPAIYAYREHLSFEIAEDGVKVLIKDIENEPMFSLGRADFQNYSKKILQWLSSEFNAIPKKIFILGYTDSIPYKQNASYTNWELSVDRANATRRMLIQHGMSPDKVIRIAGSANLALLDKKREYNSVNRRIEIIILTDTAAKKIMNG